LLEFFGIGFKKGVLMTEAMGHVGASILNIHTVEIIDYTFGFQATGLYGRKVRVRIASDE
jgi:hypothetical protein